MHLACTTYLTHMHAGGRSAEAIDAGQVLPGYSGVIVRDGYAGYGHLTDALRAWCGTHYAEAGIMPRSWLKLLVAGVPWQLVSA